MKPSNRQLNQQGAGVCTPVADLVRLLGTGHALRAEETSAPGRVVAHAVAAELIQTRAVE